MTDSDRPTALVTGATGAVGPLVVEALRNSGYRVRTFSLYEPRLQAPAGDVEMVYGDVRDLNAISAAVTGMDAVVHLAALLHKDDPPTAHAYEYESINVGGTANVVLAAQNAAVKRLLFFSTISVYGPTSGCVVTEETRPKPDTHYARTKLAAEELVMSAKNSKGEALGTVLRLGAVYGARVKGNYGRLLQALAHNRFVPVGSGTNRRSLIYEKDVARAAALALIHPAAVGRIFNLTDGSFATVAEIVAAICSALGRKTPKYSLPVAPVRFAVQSFEKVARTFGMRSPVTCETIDKYMEDIAVDSSRLQNMLGFCPQYGLLDGWQEAVETLRERGEL